MVGGMQRWSSMLGPLCLYGCGNVGFFPIPIGLPPGQQLQMLQRQAADPGVQV